MKKLWTSEAKKEKSNNLKRRDIELGELIKMSVIYYLLLVIQNILLNMEKYNNLIYKFLY